MVCRGCKAAPALAAAFAAVLWLGGVSHAAAFTASNATELQQAVNDAEATVGPDTITLAAGTYNIGTDIGSLEINDSSGGITITGPGASTTILDGNGTTGFATCCGTVDVGPSSPITIAGVTIQNSGGDGLTDNGDVTLRDSIVQNNAGAGIESTNIRLVVSGTTISGNGTTANTFENNAGLYNEADLSAVNTTIANNNGWGFSNDFSGAIGTTLTNVTIAGNNLSGIQSLDTFNVVNTITANNTGGDCASSGNINSLGHNLASDASCGFVGPGDLNSVDPLLGPLANNGGPTPTMALGPGSPAIDAGDDTACPSTDQRGVTRPQGPHCDIGAFEAITTAQSMIGNLIGTVQGLGLARGIANSLVVKLEAARAALDRGQTKTACNNLGAFINEVQARSGSQPGKTIPIAAANDLIAAAGQIKSNLGC
jgi:hypothetical protein